MHSNALQQAERGVFEIQFPVAAILIYFHCTHFKMWMSATEPSTIALQTPNAEILWARSSVSAVTVTKATGKRVLVSI